MGKVIKSVGRFFFKYSGLEDLFDEIQVRVTAYKRCLNIVPVTYKLFISLVGIAIGASGMYVYFEGKSLVASLLEANTVTFVSTVEAETPEKVEEVKIEVLNVKEIVEKVYRLESSRGKNDSCKVPGKVNGFGYATYAGKAPCFNSHDEIKTIVEGWFQDKMDRGMTVGQATCLYNTGTAIDDCPYYQKFLSL